MNEPWVIVNRLPYEEPYHTHLEVFASNGTFAGGLDIYCAVEEVAEIGAALLKFPSAVPDEYEYRYGSPDPTARMYRHFMLRAYTVDHAGHCALQFVMDRNTEPPDDGRCVFSMRVDSAQLARLGRLFQRLAERPSTAFRWTLANAEFAEGSLRSSA